MLDIPIYGSILILGDGNFSFSLSLFKYLKIVQLESTFVTSVLQSKAECFEIHEDSEANCNILEELGVQVFFELDATRLPEDARINGRKFDTVIFNFPHNGGKTNRRKCRDLLRKIMISCSQLMHSTSRFYLSLARGQSGLRKRHTTSDNEQSLENYEQIKDSWAAIYEASYADLILDRLIDFPSDQLIENGYNCTGYKNKSQKFFISGAETLIFRKSEAFPLNWSLHKCSPRPRNSPINPLLVHFSHDISFWTDENFAEEDFFDIVYKLSHGLIINMSILSEFRPNTTNDRFLKALCCRFIWQSSRFSLSKETVGDMQMKLRDEIDSFDFEKFAIKIK